MELLTLLSYLHEIQPINLKKNPIITSIEMDSREVKKGSLFICVKGYTVDGHDYAEQAVKNGAAAIIAEKDVPVDVPVIKVKDSRRAMAILADAFYGQPTHKLHLIGVTGTNGKTTTTYLIDQIFQAYGKKTGLIGTIQMKIGNETFETKNTTPESLTLQKVFHQMLEKGVETAVMEVSSHALDMGRVHGCDFDVAVFTNLTQDHLDYHETMEKYLQAKGLLFAQLGNRYNHQKPKFAVLNSDEPASSVYKRMTAAHIITYGIDHDSDIIAKNIVMTSNGTSFDLVTPTEKVKMNIQLIGRFSVYNVLAAVAASLASGVPLDVIVDALEKTKGVPGRFEVVNVGQKFTVIVDYAHTPDSLENVLKTIQQFAKGKIYTVVGCGGDRDRTKRPIMANIAVTYSDKAIFTSDNPRTEDPMQILKDMEADLEKTNYCSIVDRKKAIEYAVSLAKEEDVILIAGKGHETYQIIGKDIFEFDDRKVAAEAIKERMS
jgi:UDP-N-acetylmuramoyl-L-alanyl-D-glutamate--2,6-diaminopimelate ligase